jgi:hypothetical protein
MFDVFCSREGARVLLGPRSVRSIQRTQLGIVVGYRCYCGHEGFELFADGARPPAQLAS